MEAQRVGRRDENTRERWNYDQALQFIRLLKKGGLKVVHNLVKVRQDWNYWLADKPFSGLIEPIKQELL